MNNFDFIDDCNIKNCECGFIQKNLIQCENCIELYCKNCIENDTKVCLFCYDQLAALDCVKVFLQSNYPILETLKNELLKFNKYKNILDELLLIINTVEGGNSIKKNNSIYNYCTDSVEIYKLIDIYYYKLLKIMKENI